MALDITKIKTNLPAEENKGDKVSSIVDSVFAVNNESTSKKDILDNSERPTQSVNPDSVKNGGFLDTWIGDAAERLNAGGAQLGAGLFGALDKATIGLEKLGLGTRGGAFKDASDYFKNVAETSRANSVRNGGKSYSELWKEGDYAGAVGDIALQGIESIPMSISAAAATVAGAPVAGLAGIGAITASDKYDQLDTENPDMGEFAKATNAILTGTAEGLSEMLGAGVSKAWMKTLYKSLGKDKAEEAVKKGLMGQLQKHYKEFGMFYEPVEEGIEEVASQLAENITDKITGADPDRDIADGLKDSFVYGMGGGAYFSAAGAPGFAKRQYDKIKTRKDYNNAKADFSQKFANDPEMQVFLDGINSATPEEQSRVLDVMLNDPSLSEEQKVSAANLIQSNIGYRALRSPEAIKEDKAARRELMIQTEMRNYDTAVAPITADNGMIQQVYINGDKEAPVYITKGSIAASQSENGELLFDPDKSDQSLYYRDAEGNMQVVSPSQITGVASLSRIDDSRAQYEADLRTQLDMQEQVSAQQQEQEIENGDDIVYLNNEGKQVAGKVVDAFSNPEHVFLEDGTSVPRELVSKAPVQTEQVMEDNTVVNDNNVSQNEEENDGHAVSGESKVLDEASVKTLDQIKEALPKKKNGDIDYKAMTPMQQYEYTSIVESPDVALSDLKSDIEIKEEEISKLNDRVSKAAGGERAAIRDEIRQRSAELKEMQSFYSSIESQVEQIQPIKQADNSIEIIRPETDMLPAREADGQQLESSVSSIPLDDAGNPVYYKADIEDTISDLARDFDNDEVDEFVKLNRNELQKQLNKLKSKKPKVGTNKSQYLKDKKTWQEQIDDLKEQIEYWSDVDNAIKESREQPGDKAAEDIKSIGDPLNGEELAAMMLANGSLRLTRNSYERETGSGKEEGKKMFGLFTSSVNGGVNIERAGELLMLADLENGTNFFDQNDPNAGRNAIIDVLSSARTRGDLISYIKTNREAMAERERQAEYNDYAIWCEDNYHLSPEDYEAYEQDIRKQVQSVTDELIEYINGEIADEIQSIKEEQKEIDAILAQNKESNEKVERNDEGGTGSLLEGSSQLLQDEQSVQTGRTGETKTEYTGTDNNIGVTDGTTQESASGEIESTDKIDDTKTSIEMMMDVASEQTTKQKISDAEQEVNINPTDAQKEAGNYKKGHVKIDDFDITIEQPAGSVRSGKDISGKEWSVTMNNTYGYIRGTEGVDGDHIDIFLSESPVSGNVYIVDQVNADGSFDEHKVMYGFNSIEEAKAAYLANYSPGWSGLGDITDVGKDEFKKWIGSSKRKTKPFADYKIAKHKNEDTGVRFRKNEEDNTPEEQGIVKSTKANGTYMKAPNGKTTNLNERQWAQVRTKAFKKWFGDWENDPENASKVVDKNGEPKVVYHGTRSKDEFYVFDSDKGNPSNQGGHYFSDERNFSSKFGNIVKEVFLDIKNPSLGGFDGSGAVMARSEYRDGGIFTKRNTDRYAKKGTKEYIVFNPSQIKSATDNVGIFDKENDDIRFRFIEDSDIDTINRKFNVELQQQTVGTLPKGHIYRLGKPSELLQAAGIPDLPIELAASRLSNKSMQENHPFELSEIENLPKAIQNPLAVFRSATHIGSYVVMTEIEHKGRNFVVAIQTNKAKGKIEINDIRSIHYRTSNSHMANWIEEGLLEYADKKRMSEWLSKQRYNSAEVKKLFGHATKIVESFENPTIEEGKIISTIDDLSDSLNTPVHIVRNVNEITGDKSAQKRKSKGWYDTNTGEVYLVLANAEGVADAQATIMHEIVAHKGLRGLLGNNFSSTMETVFDSLPSEVQESLMNDFGDKVISGEEYCAHMAEAMTSPGIIQKICSAIKEALRKIGIDIKMTDGDIMYMLWKSKNRLEDSDTSIESMNKILREQKVKEQVHDYDTLFRSNKPINHLPVSVEKKIDIVNDLQSRTERLYEGYVDRMIAVKKLQDMISEKTGKAIPDYMNVWMYENTLSSRNTYEISQFNEKYLNPMTASLKKLVDVGLGERDVDTYIIAKHGLERNEYMRMKSVKEYIENLKEDDIKEDLQRQIEGKTFSELGSIPNNDLQDLVAKLSGKDYSGITAIQKELKDQSIDDFISEIESKYKPEVEDLWKRIKAVNEFSLKKWFDSGMINRTTYEKVKGMYKNYVPLRGFDETMAHDVYEYYTMEGNPFNNPLKSAAGRTSRAESPFPHLVSMAESSIVGGNKNLMKLHLYRLAQHDMASKNPSGKLSVTKQWYVFDGLNEDGVEIWKPSVPEYSDDIEQYRKNVERHDEEMALLEAERKATRNPSKLRIAYILLPAEANEHAIGVKLNGEFFQVLVHGNPKVAQAVEGLNDEARTNNKFVKAVAWANRQMAANFTTRNPAFVASNLTRDLIWSTTALSVKEGSRYRNKFMRNIPKASEALVRRLKGKQDLNNPIDVMLNEFLENGGRTGYTALYSVEKYKKDIQNSIKTGKWAKTKKGYNAVLDFIQLPNEWAEDLSRFSTYMTSREEGRTILQSVSDAKEVTVNFNRKGSGKYGAGVFRGLFLFFNAAVQSLNNAYGLSLKNPKGMAAALGGFGIAGTMIPLILSMLGSDDDKDKYNGLPDYVRKNNLCIPLGWCDVDGFLKIPLPIELRAFYGIGDAVYRALIGEDEVTDAFCDVSIGLLDLFPLNPSGGTSNFTPDAFKPIVESYITNKDFTGKPIAKITPFNEYEPEYQKVYRSTSVIPVKISEYLNMMTGGDEAIRKFEAYKTLSGADIFNPAAIEHLFEGYLGGMFTTLNQSFKTFIGAPTGLNDFSWRNVPVLNRFYDTGEVNGTMMKINEKYFDYLDEMKEVQNVYRKYESMADNSPALESAKYLDKLSKYEEGKEWKRAEFIADYVEQISDYMDEIKESSDEKRKEELQKEINFLKKEMVEGLKNGKVPD